MAKVRAISFAIPEDKIVKKIPTKTQLVSIINPMSTVSRKRNYLFTNESDYYAEYQKSWFALTCKKAGWDCMRHYEILANGCIPVFKDIELCPAEAMSIFPKKLCKEANSLYTKVKETCKEDISKMSEKDIEMCTDLIERFLVYTRKHLTTHSLAMRILKDWELDSTARVLFIATDQFPDYQRDLLLHGMKMVLGKQCIELTKIEHMYTDYTQDISKLYGRGMTYSKTIDIDLYEKMPREDIWADVRDAAFDLIIYGSCHRSMEGYKEVHKMMQAPRTMIVCGEDPNAGDPRNKHICNPTWFMIRRSKFYRREPALHEILQKYATSNNPKMSVHRVKN